MAALEYGVGDPARPHLERLPRDVEPARPALVSSADDAARDRRRARRPLPPGGACVGARPPERVERHAGLRRRRETSAAPARARPYGHGTEPGPASLARRRPGERDPPAPRATRG